MNKQTYLLAEEKLFRHLDRDNTNNEKENLLKIFVSDNFSHLYVHTEYSKLGGTIRLIDLFKKAKEYTMPAIAITDHSNMFGAIDFYKQANGIKPIIGCELYVELRSRFVKIPSNINFEF
ncbi:MAG TPA: PHP domain-containing protein [Bacteroidales bacterium]|nr:PHP domain-containing protein [Bacteroidales bacterium]